MNAVGIDVSSGNTLRKAKTDKKDAVKIAYYALNYWVDLKQYIPSEDLRRSLKMLNRQYHQSVKVQTMLSNNLLSQLNVTFPGINKLFSSPSRDSDGHLKWVNFVLKFPHRDKAAKLYPSVFKKKYQSWCKENSYRYISEKAEEIHTFAREIVSSVSLNDSILLIITQAAAFLNTALENLIRCARR